MQTDVRERALSADSARTRQSGGGGGIRARLRRHRWWQWLFFLIGVATALSALITLFTAIGRRPLEMVATGNPPVGSTDFILALAGGTNSPVRFGGRADLLNNGVDFFPAVVRDIGGAKQTVNWVVYIWEDGEASDRIFDALVERARAGVGVRVLFDALGGQAAPEGRIRELTAAGGRVAWFHPLRFGEITRFHTRNHRRAIVIDGEIGYTGGMAVGDKWLGDARNPDQWRDIMVRVTGPLARSVQGAFAQSWTITTGEILVGPQFYPPEPETLAEGERINQHVSVISSPTDDAHPLRTVFWLSFAGARRRLYLTSPYFVPDDETREVVMARARAGVDVRLLLPDEHTDAKPIRHASHAYFEELLRAGVRIYEYQPTMMHSKALVVDGKWSVVGSANMDIRSKELNEENVLAMHDPGFAAQLERTFLADLGNAREIRLAEWRRRGSWARLLEKVFGLFAEQF